MLLLMTERNWFIQLL